jgi:hypothetical protein
MRSRILCVLLALAMGWTGGCATTRASYAPKIYEKPKKQPEQHPRAIDTPGRQIGLLRWGSTCPPVSGWKTESLLERAVAHAEDGMKRSCGPNSPPPKRTRIDRERQAQVNALFHEHGLDRICFYTDLGMGRPFQKPFRLSKVGPDKLALTPNAPPDLDSLGEQIWQPLAQRFVDQVGTAQLNSTQSPVRLVFVDTHPTGEGLPAKNPAPSSWHGYGMAHLGYELVCGHGTLPQDCPIHIASRLALRYDTYDYPDPPDPNAMDDPGSDNGGHQGRIGDLADAIAAEVSYWWTHDAQSKLILNLSVGWDGEYIDPDAYKQGELDAATQAVYAALDAAHTAGALVIAAAGNRSGGQTSQSPLFPAAWETGSEQVVYAVGGVDWQGLPLPNARPGGMPVRVAYADHAVANTSGGGQEPTKIYTGSSVAAVVASSIAAVVWHLQPKWEQYQVMNQMDAKATPLLSSTATFYPANNGLLSLKRLSLCSAVTDLCGPGNSCLPASYFHCPSDHTAADLSKIMAHGSYSLTIDSIKITPTSCDPQAQQYTKPADPLTPLPATSSCPMETLSDVNDPSLTQTQPPDTPCPTCSIAPTQSAQSANQVASFTPIPLPEVEDTKIYSLVAALDPDWLAQATPDTISSAILVIKCTTGSPIEERLDVTSQFKSLLPSSSMTPPLLNSVRISFGTLGERTNLDGCTASVDFKLNVAGTPTERSVQNAVYVDP